MKRGLKFKWNRLLMVLALILCCATAGFAKTSNVTFRAGFLPNQDNILTFSFSKSVFKTGKQTFTNDQIMTCDNGVGGSFEYISNREIRMYVEQNPIPGQKVTCRVNEGQFKGVSFRHKTVTVNTKPFQLIGAELMYSGKQPVIKLTFNDLVEQKEMAKNISISDEKSNELNVGLHFNVTPAEKSRTFLIMPTAHNADAKLKFVMNKVKSVHGSRLSRSVNRVFPVFSEHTDVKDLNKPGMYSFNIKSIRETDGKISLRIFLDDASYWERLSNKNLNRYISTVPKVDFLVQNRGYQYIYKDGKDYKYVDLKGDFKALTHYQVLLKRGLKTENLVLKDNTMLEVTTGHRYPYLAFESKKAYVSNVKEHVELTSTNVGKIKVKVDQLLPNNYRYFINFSNFSVNDFYKYSQVVFEKMIQLNNPNDVFTLNSLDFKEIMPKGKNGIFKVTLFHHFKEKDQNGKEVIKTLTDAKMVYVSDIGVSAKVSSDQLFLSATSLSQNTPIDGAKVTLYSVNNQVISTGSTGRDGVFVLDKAKFALTKPKSVVVEKGDDRNYLVLNQILNKVNPYRQFRVEDNYKAMAYMSRKLLRPGDNSTILVIVKDTEFNAVSEFPVEIKVTDPVNAVVLKKVITPNALGAFEVPISIPYHYKTGKYRIWMTVADRNVGKEEFSVEDFIPNRIENEVTTDKDRYAGNDVIKVGLDSKYLFGAPAGGLRAEVRLSAVNKRYQNETYPSYSFSSDYSNSKSEKSYLSTTKTVKLDAAGKANVIFKNKLRKQPPSVLKGMLTGTVFDEGRPVSAYTAFDIFPYEQMVGLMRDNTGMATSGGKEVFKTVLINPTDNQTEKRPLKIEVKKQSWFKTYDSNSSWGYRWIKDFQTVQGFTVTSGDDFDITMDESGSYLVIATDMLHGHQSAVMYRVSGWSYDPVSPRDDMRKLDITVDNRAFSPGEEMTVDIKSPIPGRLLLTVEKGGVISHSFHDMDNNTASVKLSVPEMSGNGFYVSAVVTRSTEKDDKLLPYRAFGSQFIKLDRSDNQINVGIDSLDLIEPMQPYRIKIATDAPAGSMVAVSIVDIGILQIISQKVPDIFDYFFRKPSSMVALYDIYDNLMSHELKGAVINTGGDGVSAMKAAVMKKFLSNESINKRVEPLSYWSGLVTVDENGYAEIITELPSFNGRARLVAVAVGSKRVGIASKEVTIREKVIIKPTYPRFSKVGDELEIPVRIFNKDSKDLVLTADIQSSENIEILNTPEKVQLPMGKDQLVSFRMTPNAAGDGFVIITLSTADRTFKHRVNLPVRDKGSVGAKLFTGESDQKVSINLDSDFYRKDSSQLIVNISDSYLSRFQGAFNGLISYPYGCAEQKASRVIAMLNVKPFIDENDNRSRSLLEQRDAFVNEGVAKLIRMQRYSGEFNYWENGKTVNRYASVFAADAILNAKQVGYDVPKVVTSRIYTMLTRNVNSFKADKYSYYRSGFIRMYSAYLLSINGKLKRNMVNTMLDGKVYKDNFVSRVMMAAILKNAGMTTAMNKVLKEVELFQVSALSKNRYYGGDFYSRGRDLAMGLWIYRQHFGKDEMAYGWVKTLARWHEKVQYMSTQESAFVVRALSAYYDGVKPEMVDMVLTYNGMPHPVKKQMVLTDTLNSSEIMMAPGGKQAVYNYSVEVTGNVEKPITKTKSFKAGQSGMVLNTALYKENGEKVQYDNVTQGSLLYAEVNLRASTRIENVVVSYELPSCFEPVNLRLDQLQKNAVFKDKNFKADYQDIRDDKVLTFFTLNKNTTFYLPIRAVTEGKCVMPGVHAEAMYAPEINDDARMTAYVTVKGKK